MILSGACGTIERSPPPIDPQLSASLVRPIPIRRHSINCVTVSGDRCPNGFPDSSPRRNIQRTCDENQGPYVPVAVRLQHNLNLMHSSTPSISGTLPISDRFDWSEVSPVTSSWRRDTLVALCEARDGGHKSWRNRSVYISPSSPSDSQSRLEDGFEWHESSWESDADTVLLVCEQKKELTGENRLQSRNPPIQRNDVADWYDVPPENAWRRDGFDDFQPKSFELNDDDEFGGPGYPIDFSTQPSSAGLELLGPSETTSGFLHAHECESRNKSTVVSKRDTVDDAGDDISIYSTESICGVPCAVS